MSFDNQIKLYKHFSAVANDKLGAFSEEQKRDAVVNLKYFDSKEFKVKYPFFPLKEDPKKKGKANAK